MADEFWRMRFIPNKAGIKELARTPMMLAYLEYRADKGIEAAQAIAPVKTGAYRAGLIAQVGFADNIAVGRMNATDYKSAWIEFGTYKWAAHATLRYGAMASGLTVRGGSKIRWRPRKSGGWY